MLDPKPSITRNPYLKILKKSSTKRHEKEGIDEIIFEPFNNQGATKYSENTKTAISKESFDRSLQNAKRTFRQSNCS